MTWVCGRCGYARFLGLLFVAKSARQSDDLGLGALEHRQVACGPRSDGLQSPILEKPLLDILAAPQLLGLFKIVVGRIPELSLCKRITRCSRPRVEVVRHVAKFGDRRHANISFRPTCFGATRTRIGFSVFLKLRLCPPGNLSKIAHTPTLPRTPQSRRGSPDCRGHGARAATKTTRITGAPLLFAENFRLGCGSSFS
jgi:hypothetical protein